MAKIHKLSKNGQTIYPATTTDAVVHPTLKVSASKLIGEINVSNLFPTGGSNGTNKYTLESAITKIPTDLRIVGIKCSFLDEDGMLESWEYQTKKYGFTSPTGWMQIGSKITRQDNILAGVNSPYYNTNFVGLAEVDYTQYELTGKIKDGEVIQINSRYHTSPIELNRGDCLIAYCNSERPFWLTDASGSFYTAVEEISQIGGGNFFYKFIATTDCYVSVSYVRTTHEIPASSGIAFRLYKYVSGIDTTLKDNFEALGNRIKQTCNRINSLEEKSAIYPFKESVSTGKNITAYNAADNPGRELKQLSVLVSGSSKEGRIIISYFDSNDELIRLQDNVELGRIYHFDLETPVKLLYIQNFTGADAVISGEVYCGVIDSLFSMLLKSGNSLTTIQKEFSDLKSTFSSLQENVDADFEKIIETIASSNLFNKNDPEAEYGKYLNTATTIANNSNLNVTGYIPVKEGVTYYFGSTNDGKYSRTTAFYDADKVSIVDSFMNSAVYSITAPQGAAYMRCSFQVSKWEQSLVNEGELKPYEDYFEPYQIVKIKDGTITYDKLADDVKRLIGNTKFNGFAGNGVLSPSSYFSLLRNHISKNYVLSAKIEGTLTDISIGVGYSDNSELEYRSYDAMWVDISSTQVKQYRYYNDGYQLIDTKEHGMSFTQHTAVEISQEISTAKLRIYDDLGNIYEQDLQIASGTPFIYNGGATDLDVSLHFFPRELNKKIWAFGDSYFSFTANYRWPYYFAQYGYTDWLSNNQPGLSPENAYGELENLLTLGYVPKYVVWCLGMNGDTTETKDENTEYVINSYQKKYLDKVVSLCSQYDIEPILATIPTVPERSKIGLSKYVRNLGYRYIDFAKAVGATEEGVWNTGLLSSDNVHPTELGAKVLASQVLIDFPEMTLMD